MNLGKIEGQFPVHNSLIYAAADRIYFDTYARPLIVSAARNVPDYAVHLHIYDPAPDQLQWASLQPNLTVTWEVIDQKSLKRAAKTWPHKVIDHVRQAEMQKKSKTLSPGDFADLMYRTYCACVRFIRLDQILNSQTTCLSIDVDGLIRKPFSLEFDSKDIHLYEKPKDGTHLAGALLFQPHTGSRKFLQTYAQELQQAILADNIYWFLDQVILDKIVPQFNKGLLPMSYIDWAMKDTSAIWSAKGKRKELQIFTRELSRYRND